ncbi:hypothetical protein [Halomonas salipaludis]|uniref:hypothetical protein n=1 Tax=Halomonas salipaludis TaxID=2032625 RepID=UPI0015954E6D|nr:hypothetical protein [Halomonas salipaludis]
MIALLYRLAPHEGVTQSQLSEVRFMRSDRPPGEEVREMKASLALLSPERLADLAVSH